MSQSRLDDETQFRSWQNMESESVVVDRLFAKNIPKKGTHVFLNKQTAEWRVPPVMAFRGLNGNSSQVNLRKALETLGYVVWYTDTSNKAWKQTLGSTTANKCIVCDSYYIQTRR